MKPYLTGLAAIALGLTLLIGGCVYKPVHPTKSEQDWTVDHTYCEEWAREGIRQDPDTYDALDEMAMIKKCMSQKGWSWERTSWFKSKTDPPE